MSAFVPPRHAPRLDAELKPIIHACLQIRRRSAQLLRCSEQIALIAVNAGISASNSARNRGVFIALASQTKEIAVQISQTVQLIQATSFALVGAAAPGLLRLRSLSKLDEAAPRLRDRVNRQRMTEAVRQSSDGVRRLFHAINGQVFQLRTQHQAILVMIEKIEAVKVYFKIEASRDAAHGMYLDTIHDELGTLSDTMEAIASDIADVLAAYDQHYAALKGFTRP